MIKFKISLPFLMLKIIKSLFSKNGKLTLISKNISDLWIKKVINTDKQELLKLA
jgi:hypothetical protein